jgi:hypothetical protein
MNDFQEYITEQQNTHMTHIEDKVLYGGVDGTRQAINALRELRNLLGGKRGSRVSVKWDGAPAIFAGIDPRDGEFFVAKKSIFNKNPKVYKTDAEVDADTSGDLAIKLKDALKYLPALGIKGVIQGDFLFGRGDVQTEEIDGENYSTFHPNTLVYAIPYKQAVEVRRAKIGIVWHTSYTGNTFETMRASYGVDVASLSNSRHVWSQDAMLNDMRGATLTKRETESVNEMLSTIGRLFNSVSGTTLRELEGNQTLAQHIEQFNNTYVREGQTVTDTRAHTAKLIRWIKAKYQKEINARKTTRGKTTQQRKLDELISFFSTENRANLIKIFELQKLIVLAKLKLINKLNSIGNFKTFVKSTKGYKVAGQEGFVAIDTLGGDAVKLVDRMEFSYNNFSPKILKGWQTPKRR